MDLSLNIYTMNQHTLDIWNEGVIEQAGNRENPMPYLRIVSTIEVVVDNTLDDGVIEVFDKSIYKAMKKEGEDSDG